MLYRCALKRPTILSRDQCSETIAERGSELSSSITLKHGRELVTLHIPGSANSYAAGAAPRKFSVALNIRQSGGDGLQQITRDGRTKMTLEELADDLKKLIPGNRFCLTEEQFSGIFPPGRQDYEAMKRAGEFAHDNDCDVDAKGEICFVKKKERKTIKELGAMVLERSRDKQILQMEILAAPPPLGWTAKVMDGPLHGGVAKQEHVDRVVQELQKKYDLKPY